MTTNYDVFVQWSERELREILEDHEYSYEMVSQWDHDDLVQEVCDLHGGPAVVVDDIEVGE